MTADRGVVLALSGGAVRGVAHIAVIEELERAGIPVAAIAGTSAGSLVGALYAAGMSVREMRRLALRTAWREIVRLSFPKKGLIDSEGIGRFMEEILPVRDFAHLSIPFTAVATDLQTGEKVNLTEGLLSEAVRASCSLPVIFSPTVLGGRTLVDGGVASLIPVRSAREVFGDLPVVAVSVNEKAPAPSKFDNLFQIATQVSVLLAKRSALEEKKLADIFIPVDVSGIALYDVTKTKELLRRGRKAARPLLPALRVLMQGPSPAERGRDGQGDGVGLE